MPGTVAVGKGGAQTVMEQEQEPGDSLCIRWIGEAGSRTSKLQLGYPNSRNFSCCLVACQAGLCGPASPPRRTVSLSLRRRAGWCRRRDRPSPWRRALLAPPSPAPPSPQLRQQ